MQSGFLNKLLPQFSVHGDERWSSVLMPKADMSITALWANWPTSILYICIDAIDQKIRQIISITVSTLYKWRV